MRYGSICSGIESATVAWRPLGWQADFFAENDRFPSHVLKHHYPDVPNLGDITKFDRWHDHAIDLLVGGTPCQSFSIAGLRQGLDDPRGNLMLTYLAIARRYRPKWVVWENVPGVLSSGNGRDFATLLRGLAECGYHAAWRVLDAQYIRVDGFGRAVPQRRRRVYAVGYLGDWRYPAAVLLERQGLSRDPAPRRQAQESLTADAGGSAESGGFRLVAFGEYADDGSASSMKARDYKDPTDLIAHSLRADGFDASEDGTGRGTPLIPIAFDCKASGRSGFGVGEIASTMRSMNNQDSHANDGSHLAVAHAIQAGALRENPLSGPDGVGVQREVAYTLEARAEVQAVQQRWAVRRLTPRECERLMGFPDDYTLVPWRGKLATDGPRYKALGNAMAVNTMRWIGTRIAAVEALKEAA
ncbi:MAG TPA: DNA (cytosine-5-)-methyltransferase [Phyllobacterium sp.]|nr:DNA (cytosine-5-)-methyltransferase [Phyllobacterium sp.]